MLYNPPPLKIKCAIGQPPAVGVRPIKAWARTNWKKTCMPVNIGEAGILPEQKKCAAPWSDLGAYPKPERMVSLVKERVVTVLLLQPTYFLRNFEESGGASPPVLCEIFFCKFFRMVSIPPTLVICKIMLHKNDYLAFILIPWSWQPCPWSDPGFCWYMWGPWEVERTFAFKPYVLTCICTKYFRALALQYLMSQLTNPHILGHKSEGFYIYSANTEERNTTQDYSWGWGEIANC